MKDGIRRRFRWAAKTPASREASFANDWIPQFSDPFDDHGHQIDVSHDIERLELAFGKTTGASGISMPVSAA